MELHMELHMGSIWAPHGAPCGLTDGDIVGHASKVEIAIYMYTYPDIYIYIYIYVHTYIYICILIVGLQLHWAWLSTEAISERNWLSYTIGNQLIQKIASRAFNSGSRPIPTA